MKIRKKAACKHHFISVERDLYGGLIAHGTYYRSKCECVDCNQLLYIDSSLEAKSIIQTFSEHHDEFFTRDELLV